MNEEERRNFPNADLVNQFLGKDDIELIGWLTKDEQDYRHQVARAVLDLRSSDLLRKYTEETVKIAERTWWAAAGACAALAPERWTYYLQEVLLRDRLILGKLGSYPKCRERWKLLVNEFALDELVGQEERRRAFACS